VLTHPTTTALRSLREERTAYVNTAVAVSKTVPLVAVNAAQSGEEHRGRPAVAQAATTPTPTVAVEVAV
jgi:hypothetical protein